METGFSARAATAAEEGVKATLVSFVKTNEATHNIVNRAAKSTEQKLTERINALEEQLKKQAEEAKEREERIIAALQALSATPPKTTDLA